MKLAGLSAVITGASRGLGRALAIRFAKEGAGIVICSRTAGEIETVAQELRRKGSKVLAVKADVSKERDVDRLKKVAFETYGRIGVLNNNAGILTPRAPIHEVKVVDWDASIAVNLRGAFLCVAAFLPQMLAERHGSIVNISSGAGKRHAPLWGPYAVSKFGIEGLTGLMAEETREAGVRVNAVNPGRSRTAMRATAYPDEDPMRLPTPEDITGIFVYLASDASNSVTGQSLEALEWLKRHPEWR